MNNCQVGVFLRKRTALAGSKRKWWWNIDTTFFKSQLYRSGKKCKKKRKSQDKSSQWKKTYCNTPMNHESRRWSHGSQPCCATRTRHMDGSCLSREALNRDWASVVSKFPLWFKLQVQKSRKLQIKLPKSEVVPIDVHIFIFKWLMLTGLLFSSQEKT